MTPADARNPAADLPPLRIAGPADARAVIERQLAALMRLMDVGLAAAEEAGRQALAPAPAPGADAPAAMRDPGLVYARVSRAVRLTIALQSQLLKDVAALDRAEAVERVGVAQRRRVRVRRVVDAVVEAEHEGDAFEAARLSRDVRERLETEDLYGCLADRSVSEVVAAICRDLGLSPDWAALAEEAWAREEVAAGAACAPLLAAAPGPARAWPQQGTAPGGVAGPVPHAASP